MKNVLLAVFAAVGFVMASMPYSYAGDRPASKQYTQYTPVSQQYASSTPQNGSYERKCMTLPCGSTWCYKVRR